MGLYDFEMSAEDMFGWPKPKPPVEREQTRPIEPRFIENRPRQYESFGYGEDYLRNLSRQTEEAQQAARGPTGPGNPPPGDPGEGNTWKEIRPGVWVVDTGASRISNNGQQMLFFTDPWNMNPMAPKSRYYSEKNPETGLWEMKERESWSPEGWGERSREDDRFWEDFGRQYREMYNLPDPPVKDKKRDFYRNEEREPWSDEYGREWYK